MEISRIIDGKKFMWDGVEYKDGNEANGVVEKYRTNGFETSLILEQDKFYVFTRRVVTEVKVEGAPSA
jgi:hypothetical protein